MITEAQYFGQWRYAPDVTAQILSAAQLFLARVNGLMASAKFKGVEFKMNPVTKSQISGAEYGGFRPIGCPIGAPGSAHKLGRAVDIFDPLGEIDAWCMKNTEPGGLLAMHEIYIEDPGHTPHWSHWTNRKPVSGNRVFHP